MNDAPRHRTLAELEAGLDEIRRSPRDAGTVEMIVRRPVSEQREVLDEGRLEPEAGLVGDRWGARTPRSGDSVTLMSSRVIALLAQQRSRWPLAGDQLYVDLDLSASNLPPGTRLAVGSAVVEVSTEPHTPCRKFRKRYGIDAVRFVGSDLGKALQLRGVNANVVVAGAVRTGDVIRKL